MWVRQLVAGRKRRFTAPLMQANHGIKSRAVCPPSNWAALDWRLMAARARPKFLPSWKHSQVNRVCTARLMVAQAGRVTAKMRRDRLDVAVVAAADAVARPVTARDAAVDPQSTG